MDNKSGHFLGRFLSRSLRIAIGFVILVLVIFCATIAREIASSSISFESLPAKDIFTFILFAVLAYLLFILIWPVAFGKEPLNLTKVQARGREIKKRVTGFIKMWIRG